MPDNQHYYTCPDPKCPVVVFVDRLNATADPTTGGWCPGSHELSGGIGALIVKEF